MTYIELQHLTWPEAQRRVRALLERGLQQDRDFEKRWPAVLGTLLETVDGGMNA